MRRVNQQVQNGIILPENGILIFYLKPVSLGTLQP